MAKGAAALLPINYQVANPARKNYKAADSVERGMG
jgi:hypothetical protein